MTTDIAELVRKLHTQMPGKALMRHAAAELERLSAENAKLKETDADDERLSSKEPDAWQLYDLLQELYDLCLTLKNVKPHSRLGRRIHVALTSKPERTKDCLTDMVRPS